MRAINWFGRIFGRRPALDAPVAAALENYLALAQPDPRVALAAQRVVVVDVESSGLNPFRDRLISIGALAARGGLVLLGDSFEVVLRQEQPSDAGNILVHGIGGTAQLGGADPAAGLAAFLQFAGKAPLVAFNADFDRILIERASLAALGVKPGNVWLDLAALAPALFPGRHGAARTLDGWLAAFGIENHARHDALADAFATAQLMLVVLAEAGRRRTGSLSELMGLEQAQRWLEQASKS